MSLKAIQGRVVVKVDTQSKNSHTFSNGMTIRLERGWNNLDKGQTEPVNAEVISGTYIPEGSLILIHHNATHDTYRIFNYRQTSGTDIADSVRYYSIPEEQCFAWHDGESWKPMRNFEFGLRIFVPYTGKLAGIAPKFMKDTLYVTTGEFSGKVCHTLKACDYQIIYQGLKGQEERLIRFRHSQDPGFDREEIVAINEHLTDKVNNGEIWVGLNPTDAKPLNNYVYAS